MLIAMFWANWGINEWGAFAAVVTAILTFGGGVAVIKVRNWAVKIGKDTAVTAAAMFHLSKTTATVNETKGRMDRIEPLVDKHEVITTDHGKRWEVLEVWKDAVGRTLKMVTPAEPPEIKETVQGP